MMINKIIQSPVGADYAVSKLHVDDKRGRSSTKSEIIIRIHF